MDRREFLITSSCVTAAAVVALPRRAAESVGAGPGAGRSHRAPAGPLRTHPDNPRYFTDGSGRAIYLTGSHTWLDLQDVVDVKGGVHRRPPPFDYAAFLDFLERCNHNFFRLWAWESPSWVLPDSTVVRLSPLPFARTGPGRAHDGLPRFDPTKFDQEYFERLRRRVAAAGERGIYVGVMLFQGFSVSRKSKRRKVTPWDDHPFRKGNNTLGIDGDANGDGEGYEIHTLRNPAVTKLQEAYVRQVIDTVGDLDNVIYEISNESHGGSTRWQFHMIDLIHRCEKSRPKQHPVWMSYQWDGIAGRGSNRDLFRSPAEIISPSPNVTGRDQRYRRDPPAADGSKIIIADTDHLWGIGGNAAWVWKCFMRGMHPIFMDPYRNSPHHWAAELDPKWDPVRRAMGQTRRFAEKVNLAAMTPRNDLASTGCCLANPGVEYLVYFPSGGTATVDLSAARGALAYEWFNPRTGTTAKRGTVRGAARRKFTVPFPGHAVLHLRIRHQVTRTGIAGHSVPSSTDGGH